MNLLLAESAVRWSPAAAGAARKLVQLLRGTACEPERMLYTCQ